MSMQPEGGRSGARSRGGLAIAILAIVVVLSACANAGTDAREAGDRAAVPDPNGILQAGYPLPVAGAHFDPTLSVLPADMPWMSLVYGTLTRHALDGTVRPYMAKNAEVVDPATVRIELRPNVTFTDGAAFDASAVRTSLMRARTPATPGAAAGMDPGLRAVADVEVVDPLTAVVRLNAPLAGQFLVELSQRSGIISSPRQIASNPEQIDTMPIGAGPFVVKEVVPQQRISFTKNPGFWDEANVKLGGVDIVNTPIGEQNASGLLAGTLDFAPFIPIGSAASVQASGQIATSTTNVANTYMIMCSGKEPFNSEAVRQAVQIGIDRDRFVQLVYGGLAKPAYSVFPEDNRNFAPEVPGMLKYDADKAKQLLARSGVADPTISLHFATTLAFGKEAEALQAQLRQIGFKVDITPERDLVAGFITPKAPGAFITSTISAVAGYGLYYRMFGPNGFFALCGVDRPDVMKFTNAAAALSPNDPAATAAYQEAQRLVAQHAYVIPIATAPYIGGWNTDRVGGTPAYNAQGYLEVESLHIKK